MKEKILKLRKEGKSYREIKKLLGCSTSTISFHCGEGQKEKSRIRRRKNKKSKLINQISKFKSKGSNRVKAQDFQRKRDSKGNYKGGRDYNFTTEDLIRKIGDNPICYLSGRSIDITKSRSFHLDHIIPVSRGGNNSLSNLGLTCKEANKAKDNLTVNEFIFLCRDVLEHNGYKVSKIKKS